jgi:hypothetical protein
MYKRLQLRPGATIAGHKGQPNHQRGRRSANPSWSAFKVIRGGRPRALKLLSPSDIHLILANAPYPPVVRKNLGRTEMAAGNVRNVQS